MNRRGFSLIELIITLVIISILASIVGVSYHHQVVRVWRVEASTALLEAGMRMEAYHFDYHTYVGATPALLNMPELTEGQHYKLCVENADAEIYQLRADPLFEDTACDVFLFNSVGEKQVRGWAGVGACW